MVGQSVVDPAAGTVTPNNISGYPEHTQNAIWGENEQLKIYAKDGFIYNASGNQIYPSSHVSNPCPLPNTYGHSEYIFVPIPNACDKFYSIAVDRLPRVEYEYSFAEDENPYSFELFLNYSIIDMQLNSGAGGIELQPLQGSPGQTTDAVYYKFNYKRTNSSVVDNTHIGVTKARVDGTRFLFVYGSDVIWVFHVTSSGINLVLEEKYTNGGNVDFTSELEIYETNNEYFIAIPKLRTAIVNYNTAHESGMEIFVFDKSNSISLIQYQYIPLTTFGLPPYVISGVEFSENGEHLYATFFEKVNNFSWESSLAIRPINLVLHFVKNGLNYNSTFPVNLGPNTDDFSLGMIELGDDGALYIAGENRIGKFSHSNTLTSYGTGLATDFVANAIQIDNTLHRHFYKLQNSFCSQWSYGLPDQIDGENFMDFNYVDYLPETLTVCELPEMITTPQSVNWYKYPEKGGSDLLLEPNYLGSGSSFAIGLEGLYTISFADGNGCLNWEDVYIQQDPIVIYGANFNYSISYPAAYTKEISVTSQLTNVNHIWKVYQKDASGNWVLFLTDYSQSPNFVGLDDPGQVKIEHQIILNDPINCPFNDIQTIIIQ